MRLRVRSSPWADVTATALGALVAGGAALLFARLPWPLVSSFMALGAAIPAMARHVGFHDQVVDVDDATQRVCVGPVEAAAKGSVFVKETYLSGVVLLGGRRLLTARVLDARWVAAQLSAHLGVADRSLRFKPRSPLSGGLREDVDFDVWTLEWQVAGAWSPIAVSWAFIMVAAALFLGFAVSQWCAFPFVFFLWFPLQRMHARPGYRVRLTPDHLEVEVSGPFGWRRYFDAGLAALSPAVVIHDVRGVAHLGLARKGERPVYAAGRDEDLQHVAEAIAKAQEGWAARAREGRVPVPADAIVDPQAQALRDLAARSQAAEKGKEPKE